MPRHVHVTSAKKPWMEVFAWGNQRRLLKKSKRAFEATREGFSRIQRRLLRQPGRASEDSSRIEGRPVTGQVLHLRVIPRARADPPCPGQRTRVRENEGARERGCERTR
eukprot:6190920-Pleurochrysis_carterae.AAC.2